MSGINGYRLKRTFGQDIAIFIALTVLWSFDLTKSSAVADSFHSHVRRRAVSSGAFFRDHCFCCDVERSRIGPDERIPPIKVYSIVTTHVSSVGNTLEVDIDLSVFKKK